MKVANVAVAATRKQAEVKAKAWRAKYSKVTIAKRKAKVQSKLYSPYFYTITAYK